MIDLRAKALRGIALSIAHDNVGIYPQSITGKNGYEKRTDRMEGWNECAMAHSSKAVAVTRWIKSLPDGQREKVEDLLLADVLELFFDDDGSVRMAVNCNDVFVWGCSDCEDISLEELPGLARAIDEASSVGAESGGELIWVARKREMRPQGAFYAYVDPAICKIFDTCGPFREAGLGNPVASSFEASEEYRKKRKSK